MFRRPDSDEEDYGSRTVKAKPMAEKYAKKLGYSTGKDFVVGSSRSQNEFYGHQEVKSEERQSSSSAALTEDEKNKIHAKIMKAEMKGDKDLVRKLKRKLEGREEEESGSKEKIMMKRSKSGNVIPASSKRDDRDRYAQGSSRMNREYGKSQELDEMVREEKTGSAKDQLRMFERSIVKSAKIKRHDDESLDDIAEMQKVRKKMDERDQRKKEKEQRREHKRLEKSLDDCVRCIESSQLMKHTVVAVGINTYLAVVEWDGLDEQHLLIIPTGHCSSSIQLDENVWDEMRLWRKGLTAMWREDGRDCIFMEMSRNKAINECEGEYTDNKKLIETKDLRRQIPKGFSYFAVDFGLQNGYAHVIENNEAFPANFGHEIIAGMLDLPHNKWRKKEKQEFAEVKAKCDRMKTVWEPFDWTKKIKRD